MDGTGAKHRTNSLRPRVLPVVTTVTTSDHAFVAHRLLSLMAEASPSINRKNSWPGARQPLRSSRAMNVILPLHAIVMYCQPQHNKVGLEHPKWSWWIYNQPSTCYGWLWRLWADNLVTSLWFLGLHHLHRWWNHQLHTLGVEGIRWPASQNHCQTLSGGANTDIDPVDVSDGSQMLAMPLLHI